MKIQSIRLKHIAGYPSLVWDRVHPQLNFLLGRNGAGKSTLIQTLSLALNYLGGQRTEDLVTRSYPDGEIQIELDGLQSPLSLTVRSIRASQTARRRYPFSVLQVVENRQPKNILGELRNEIRQHPSRRYANTVSELKFLLESDEEADRAVASQVFHICKTISAAGSHEDWAWIEREIRERSRKKARPLSCGQFDIAALVLDLVRFKDSHADPHGSTFILLDNPETYLHPACQEPILQLVREMFPEAQLFISSHSLKLLCHREPKTVFWLSRELRDGAGNVCVQSIRELEGGSKALFFELYGDEPSSAVLSLLYAYESPEYFDFLRMCALPSESVCRDDPSADRQMTSVRGELNGHASNWTILDFGAGDGDLLAALLGWGDVTGEATYIALVKDAPSVLLERRMDQAKARASIAKDSRIARQLADVPGSCDAVVLCNVCHEILPPELPVILATLLSRHLRKAEGRKLIIHEVETLSVGEKNFIMWTPADFQRIFKDIPGLSCEEVPIPPGAGVPLHTTTIRPSIERALPGDLEDLLVTRFWDHLEDKKDACLEEIEQLSRSQTKSATGMDEALRQRRRAFLVAQVVTICLLERESPLIVRPPSVGPTNLNSSQLDSNVPHHP